MRKKIFFSVLLIVFIISIITLVLMIYLNSRKYNTAYIDNGNIYISNESKSNAKQITFDASVNKGIKYGYPEIFSVDVYFFKCTDSVSIGDNNKCEIVKFNLENSQTTTYFKFDTVKYINTDSIAWNKTNHDLIFATKDTLYLLNNTNLKQLMKWDVLDMGSGGPFCSKTNFNNDFKYFTFCDASAVGLSIQGNIYLFKSSGEQVKEFKPSQANKKLGLVEPEFVENMLKFKDTTNNLGYSYSIIDNKLITE
ncbi:MAG: hypothetical protein ABI721_03075 [Candidatus Dojkabacteria bacterium]